MQTAAKGKRLREKGQTWPTLIFGRVRPPIISRKQPCLGQSQAQPCLIQSQARADLTTDQAFERPSAGGIARTPYTNGFAKEGDDVNVF